jgi:hypothetical protein
VVRIYTPAEDVEDDEDGENEDREASDTQSDRSAVGGRRADGAASKNGTDTGDILAKGLRVADAYLDGLLEAMVDGPLDSRHILNLSKLLPSLNIIKRDNPDGDKLLNAPPEEVAQKMADALGPEAVARALVDLVGEDAVSSYIKRAGRQSRAAKLK